MEMQRLNRSVRLILVLLLMLLAGGNPVSYAQSKETITTYINGKGYRVHIVEKGESLYGLSMKYGVSQAEIVESNPGVYNGLKKGQRLLIPLHGSDEDKANSGLKAEDEEFTLHVVAAGETLYSISRRYGVSVPLLRQVNKLTSDTLHLNSLLRIPTDSQTKGKSDFRVRTVYVVQEGDTFYSIARNSGVDVDELRRVNGFTTDHLSVGTLLEIPSAENTLSQNELVGSNSNVYVVQKGDGLYSIARKFNTTPEALHKANPQLEDGIYFPGSLMRIPLGTKDVIHVMRDGDSFHSIAQKYNVTVEDLYKANPRLQQGGLKKWGLQEGELLNIPSETQPKITMEALAKFLGVDDDRCKQQTPFDKRKTLRVALILPFNIDAKATDSLRRSDAMHTMQGSLPETKGPLPVDERFLDFYRGMLMTLQHFQTLGYSINLSVFDSQRSESVVRSIVDRDSLRNVHLIIGPVYPKNVSIVSRYAAQHRICMVSPLSGNTSMRDVNPYFYQANPSFYTQLRAFVRALKARERERIIVLKEESIEDWEVSENLQLMLQNELSGTETSANSTRVHTVVVPKGKSVNERLGQLKHLLLPDGKLTTVIVPSNNEVFVTDAVGQLSALKKSEGANIAVYGLPSWQKMLRVDFSQLVYLQTVIFTPFYTDYDSFPVRAFVEAYRALYRAEPSQFSFQGWDVATYFINLIFKYGEDFQYCLASDKSTDLLQNCFHFEQSKEFSSYESEGVFLLRYDEGRGLVLHDTF